MTDDFVINLDITYEIGKLITDIDIISDIEIILKQVSDATDEIIASDN